MDDYAKDGGPGAVWLLYSFSQDPLRASAANNVNNFVYLKLYKSRINLRDLQEQFEDEWRIWVSYLTKQKG